MMTMLLAGRAWISERLNLPQQQTTAKESTVSKEQNVEAEPEKPKAKQQPPQQTSVKLSAKEKAELKKKLKQQQEKNDDDEDDQEQEGEVAVNENNKDDDEEENDDDDDDEEDEMGSQQNQQQVSKKATKNKKASSAKEKKKKAVARAQQRTTQNLATQVSSQMISQKMIADRKFIESQQRTCLLKEFPHVFEEELDKKNAAQTLPQSTAKPYDWQPAAAAASSPSSGLPDALLHDYSLRRKAILDAPLPTFAHDFSKLISNANLLPKSEISSYETLRRKFNSVVNETLVQILALMHRNTKRQKKNSQDHKSDSPPLILPQNFDIDAQFFYHVCSQYRCNTFGIFSAKDVQIGLAVYPTASYFNHSCAPNLLRRMDLGKCACFYAMRDIGAGEALTISYAGGFKSVASRRQYLLENYRFFCRCESCSVIDQNEHQQQQQPHEKTEETEQPKSATIIKKLKQCENCFAEGYLRPVLVPAESNKKTEGSDQIRDGVVVAGLECESCLKYYPQKEHDENSK